MKKGIILVTACALILLIFVIFYRPKNVSPKIFPLALQSERKTSANVTLIPRKEIAVPPDEIISRSNPDYVWYTQPSSLGTIKNSKGEIIFQASNELPFISMRSSVSVSKIVIISGNRNAFVIDPETKQQVALPKQPPEEGAKGFDTWEWLDNNTLLAEYSVPREGNENSVSCCEGHEIAETRLYVYNLKSNTLVKVVLPNQLKGTVFSIGRIAADGSVEVSLKSNHLDEGKRVGWFNIHVTNGT